MDVLMKCGHTSNGFKIIKDKERVPCCVICNCEEVEKEKPSLEGRTAKCTYFGKTKPNRRFANDECNYGCQGKSECCCGSISSSYDLAFFKHTPEKDQDEFYCGCRGWD